MCRAVQRSTTTRGVGIPPRHRHLLGNTIADIRNTSRTTFGRGGPRAPPTCFSRQRVMKSTCLEYALALPNGIASLKASGTFAKLNIKVFFFSFSVLQYNL